MRRRVTPGFGSIDEKIFPAKLFKPEPFRTIVADVPWPYGDKLPKVKTKDGGTHRGASGTYGKTMTLDEIARYIGSRAFHEDLAINGHVGPFEIAKDARLFLWRVHPMQAEALHVMKAWGFGEPVSELVWAKTTAPPLEIDATFAIEPKKLKGTLVRMAFGMGRTFRAAHEVCLVGRRGRPEVLSKSERSHFFAPTRAHSQKPEEFFEIVERVSPGPYLELFSGGHTRPGWTCLGAAHRVDADGDRVGA